VGKTVESYRVAVDKELQEWNGFAKALRSDDQLAFEQIMDACRNYASAGSNATRPVVFESMVMCVLLHQQKMLSRLERELAAARKQCGQP
jgi:hypothetical protein